MKPKRRWEFPKLILLAVAIEAVLLTAFLVSLGPKTVAMEVEQKHWVLLASLYRGAFHLMLVYGSDPWTDWRFPEFSLSWKSTSPDPKSPPLFSFPLAAWEDDTAVLILPIWILALVPLAILIPILLRRKIPAPSPQNR